MGKQFVQLVVWGIEVDKSQALLIKKTLAPKCRPGSGVYIETSSKWEVALKTDGSDYGESTSYSEDCDHVFGVVYGNSVRAMKKTPDKVQEDYSNYAQPFLDELGIKVNPKILLITQTL